MPPTNFLSLPPTLLSDTSSDNGVSIVVNEDGLFITLDKPGYAILDFYPENIPPVVQDAEGNRSTLNVTQRSGKFMLSPPTKFLKSAAYPVLISFPTPAAYFVSMVIWITPYLQLRNRRNS